MQSGHKFMKVDDSNFVSLQPESLGQNIKNIRLHLGLNMEAFGMLVCGANKGLVSRWESNKSIPNIKRLHAIAELGEVPVNELIGNIKRNHLIQVGKETVHQFERLTNDLPLEQIFSSGVKLSFENKVLSEQQKQKAMAILRLAFTL